MNSWLVASLVLGCGFVPCAAICSRADLASAVAALNLASVLAVALLMTMTVAFGRQPFIDLAVVLAPMSLVGSLAFVRFLERRR